MDEDIILPFDVFDSCLDALNVLLVVLDSLPTYATQSSHTAPLIACVRHTLDVLRQHDTPVVYTVLLHVLQRHGWNLITQHFDGYTNVVKLRDDIDCAVVDRLCAVPYP